MNKMHSYEVSNRAIRSTIRNWIVLFTFVIALLIYLYKTDSFTWVALIEFLSYSSVIAFVFATVSWIYDRFLWKVNLLDKIPNLSGTWIGIASNPYFEPLRLELMQIEQYWTGICITIEIYEENKSDPSNWLKSVRMGTEYSTNASLTECDHKYSKFSFSYDHKGKAIGQDSFNGSMELDYERGKVDELSGEYVNSKKVRHFNKVTNSEEIFEAVSGRILFRKISSEVIEIKEFLQKITSKNLLAELRQQLNAQVRGDFMQMENNHELEDEGHTEYDFSKMKGGVRGKYVERYKTGTNGVLLDPDVAQAFPTSDSVNEALRLLIQISQRQKV